MKQPVVDVDKCIGCASCTGIAPKVFVIKAGKSQVINPQGDREENIQLAIDACPTQAISWKE